MRPNTCKLRPKMAKMSAKMTKMRAKMAKKRAKMAKGSTHLRPPQSNAYARTVQTYIYVHKHPNQLAQPSRTSHRYS